MLRMLLLVAGLVWSQTANAQIQLTTSQRAAVLDGVRKTLIDPPSARFGAIRAERDGDGFLVCGTVSAKNSFGGYTDQRPFIGRLVRTGARYVYERLDPRNLWPDLCHGVDD